MKKILIVLSALIFGATNLFAWTNVPFFGVFGSFPEFVTTTGDYSGDYKFNHTGLDIGYMGTTEYNLAIKTGIKIGIGLLLAIFSLILIQIYHQLIYVLLTLLE